MQRCAWLGDLTENVSLIFNLPEEISERSPFMYRYIDTTWNENEYIHVDTHVYVWAYTVHVHYVLVCNSLFFIFSGNSLSGQASNGTNPRLATAPLRIHPSTQVQCVYSVYMCRHLILLYMSCTCIFVAPYIHVTIFFWNLWFTLDCKTLSLFGSSHVMWTFGQWFWLFLSN